jgi:hypothetical protein
LKVQKKRETVDAWQYSEQTRHAIISILDQAQQQFMPMGKDIILKTRDGELVITPGDYLIKGTQGNFYSCKPDIFNATYDIQG